MEYLEALRLGQIIGNTIVSMDRVELSKWQVPTIAGLTISVGLALDLGVPEAPATGDDDDVSVPLPVEVC